MYFTVNCTWYNFQNKYRKLFIDSLQFNITLAFFQKYLLDILMNSHKTITII